MSNLNAKAEKRGEKNIERRKARKAKMDARNFNSFTELGTAVENRKIQLSQNPALSATVSVTAQAKRAAKPQPSVDHRPVWQIYRDYFWDCGTAYEHNNQKGFELNLKEGLEKGKALRYPLPVGFIPGPLVILEFLIIEEKVYYQIIDATPDIQVEGLDEEILAPVPRRKPLKEMPVWISQAIGIQLSLIEGIGGEPTPWNLGAVGKFRREGINPGTLRLGFSQFQYPGYEAKPFGCCLVPELGTGGLKGFRLTKVYNPGKLPGIPPVGTLLTIEFLNGQGPIQKLLNTWVGMEDNFQWYVKNPKRPYQKPQPTPNHR